MEDFAGKDSRLDEARESTYTAFLIAGECFAVDVHSVKEIVKYKELTSLKEPLKDVEGLLEHHSVSIPVFNTAGILKLNPTSVDNGVMIVGIEGFILGFLVDIDAEMEVFSTITSPKPFKGNSALKDFVEGTVMAGDKECKLLKLASLVSKDVKRKLFTKG
ncbi:MAG: chemotaxis protein CheW [Proteobacteria bacterium]|nr:chemotaxis protein CheW [Pseudomonadota bacterium]